MKFLILLATVNGLSPFKKFHEHSILKGDDFMMKILHDDSIFGEFMVSGAMSREEMNAMLKANAIPLEVTADLFEKLMRHWIYTILI